MLKLEKTAKSSTLTLRLRDRDLFFNRQLLKALGIALLLHLSGLLLFHVSPFSLSSNVIFPPVEVHSDQPIAGASSLITTHHWDEDTLPPPPLQLIPHMNWVASTPTSLLMPEVALNIDVLQNLEERHWPVWQTSLTTELEEPLIRMSTSGDLANYAVVTADPSLDIKVPLKSVSGSYASVAYEVLLDERRGELFWYERIQSNGNEKVDELTEKILLNMRYAVRRSGETVGGILNFTVAASKKS